MSGRNRARPPRGRQPAPLDDCTMCGMRGTVRWTRHHGTLAWRCTWCYAGHTLPTTGATP